MTKYLVSAAVVAAAVALSACGVSPENPPTEDKHIPFSQRVTETINSITVTTTPTPDEPK